MSDIISVYETFKIAKILSVVEWIDRYILKMLCGEEKPWTLWHNFDFSVFKQLKHEKYKKSKLSTY